MNKSKKYKKASNQKVSEQFLKFKTPTNPQFTKPKWVEFCEYFIAYDNLEIFLNEAKTTNSKYLTFEYTKGNKIALYTVRFSDHAPNKKREKEEQCDFFVGVTNFKVTTTKDAILATDTWYKNLNF